MDWLRGVTCEADFTSPPLFICSRIALIRNATPLYTEESEGVGGGLKRIGGGSDGGG